MNVFIKNRTLLCPRIFRCLFTLSLILLLEACSPSSQNRPSPYRIDSGKVGDVNIKIAYSSPGVKGRKIFGIGPDYLEQYNEVWRIGANEATFITLDKPVLVASNRLDSGSYSIFAIPNNNQWTIIFNKEWDQWGAYNYKDSLDVFRIKVPVNELKEKHEWMQLFIESDTLKFRWDQTGWGLQLSNPF